jgi:hypothetical protein
VSFEGALLTTLQVNSLDGRFSVNELGSLQPGGAEYSLRWALFRTLVTSIALRGTGNDRSPLALTDVQIASLYSALVDWIDADETPYIAQGAPGAERAAYAAAVPPYEIKNRLLDRLEEVHLIQGWVDAGIPWTEFASRFATLPKSTQGGGSYLPEKLDVNLASREEISRWLTEHRIEDPVVLSSNFGTAQGNLNTLADRADAVAAALAPDGFERTLYKDMGSIQKALQGAGITASNPGNFFSVCSTYLQIRVTVDVNGMMSTLTGLVQATRDSACGKPQSMKILAYSTS